MAAAFHGRLMVDLKIKRQFRRKKLHRMNHGFKPVGLHTPALSDKTTELLIKNGYCTKTLLHDYLKL